MGTYFFLASLLPDLQIGHIPSLGYAEFKDLLKESLTSDDWKKVTQLLRLIDIENMQALWTGEPLDKHGNCNKEELEQAIQDQIWPNGQQMQSEVVNFLNKYATNKERLEHFPLLMSRFLKHSTEKSSGFLRKYFEFEKELRLVLIGFRAKLLHRDVSVELQYEDAGDPLVAQILAQKDAKIYEPPFDYAELKPSFEAYRAFPLELHKFLNEYKFQKIDLFNSDKLFSIDRILGYLEQLIIVERWLELDASQGRKMMNAIADANANRG